MQFPKEEMRTDSVFYSDHVALMVALRRCAGPIAGRIRWAVGKPRTKVLAFFARHLTTTRDLGSVSIPSHHLLLHGATEIRTRAVALKGRCPDLARP